MARNDKGRAPGKDATPKTTNTANDSYVVPEMASDWVRVGYGYSISFRAKAGGIEAVWSPDIPPARKLRRIIESGKYHQARHDFLSALAQRLGGAVVCLDL
jgi:hypothetical protein